MNIQIRKLTPELTEDYLHFFDVTPHSTGKNEHRCYCVCWAGTAGDFESCSSAEKRREVAKKYIKNGYLQGYLAYHEDKVIGWCNANIKTECFECISWQMMMNEVQKDDCIVKSVFCFAIAPQYRGQGIASSLLEHVSEDAAADGYDYVEVYPHAEFINAEQDFMGPVSMYEKQGFKACYEAGNRLVMRKSVLRHYVDRNRKSWNEGADNYAKLVHSDRFMRRILDEPSSAFHHDVWKNIIRLFPDMNGVNICVPSSGDNHAVFAFAMLGADVTSCDIAENQLANAKKVSDQYDWGSRIQYVCADSMTLDGLPNTAYELVYTSSGVHVWIDDPSAMYRSVCRVLKPGGISIMYDIHPFQRPFDDGLKIEKPYDATGPFVDGDETTFHWRLMDIMNAMISAGLLIKHVEEMHPEKNYEWPFWISLMDMENGAKATPEEVDRMFDWHNNPGMAIPCWLSITTVKPNG